MGGLVVYRFSTFHISTSRPRGGQGRGGRLTDTNFDKKEKPIARDPCDPYGRYTWEHAGYPPNPEQTLWLHSAHRDNQSKHTDDHEGINHT